MRADLLEILHWLCSLDIHLPGGVVTKLRMTSQQQALDFLNDANSIAFDYLGQKRNAAGTLTVLSAAFIIPILNSRPFVFTTAPPLGDVYAANLLAYHLVFKFFRHKYVKQLNKRATFTCPSPLAGTNCRDGQDCGVVHVERMTATWRYDEESVARPYLQTTVGRLTMKTAIARLRSESGLWQESCRHFNAG